MSNTELTGAQLQQQVELVLASGEVRRLATMFKGLADLSNVLDSLQGAANLARERQAALDKVTKQIEDRKSLGTIELETLQSQITLSTRNLDGLKSKIATAKDEHAAVQSQVQAARDEHAAVLDEHETAKRELAAFRQRIGSTV